MAGSLLRGLLGGLVFAWLCFALAVIVLRYAVLPQIDAFRGGIEELASGALGLPVRIERVSAGWDGLRPEIRLAGVRVLDRAGREVLGFRAVDAVLAWQSVAFLEPRFHRLHAEGPLLAAERTSEGRIFVAGFPVGRQAPGDPGLMDWLLAQETVSVDGATLVWSDAARGAPPLRLSGVSLILEGDGPMHRFGLVATPPPELAGRFDLRGEFSGETLARPAEWSGRFYLAAAEVDLAAWKAWIDLPAEVMRGQGALRFWGGVGGGRLVEASADLALAGVRARLGEALPDLDLTGLSGRLTVRRTGAATRLTGLDLALELADGTRISPTGFHVEWSSQDGGTRGLGLVTAADLGELAALAPFLPLGDEAREPLTRYAPAGRLDNLQFSWTAAGGRLAAYSLKTAFADLALAPSGLVPGFEGLSGKLEADERGGRLSLAAGPLALEFPAVFAEPRIALDELAAELAWTTTRRDGRLDGIDFELGEAAFSGPDAQGRVRGRYRLAGLADGTGGAGEIDLEGELPEADATAVRRYLPRVLPEQVGRWLKGALLGGRATGTAFVLRGPLAAFPFADGQGGQFLITTRLEGGRLRYDAAWPAVEGLDADLRFEGARLGIVARQAQTAGMKLARVEARIDDFAAAEVGLRVVGEAQGPVAGFTRFLDESPLGETLGRFYEEIRIDGDGRLKLDLAIPLARPEAVKLRGQFDLAGGRVRIDPMLPPVTEVAGKVSFTEHNAQASELSGQFLGRPLAVSLRADDREVRVAASGAAGVEQLKRHYGSAGSLTLGPVAPLFDGLAGGFDWQAAVSVRQGRVRIGVESTLEGLASTLPEPLAKPAERALPVRFTRSPLASERRGKALRDQFAVAVGEIAQATLVRRIEGGHTTIERGVFGIAGKDAQRVGSEKALPAEGGLRVVVRQGAIDLDAWRAALTPAAGAGAAAAAGGAAGAAADIDWPVPTFDVEAKSLRLIGRQWQDVRFTAQPRAGGLAGRVEARDTAGEWSWEHAGKGTLKARLSKLVLPEERTAGANGQGPGGAEAPESLPAIDVVAEDFVLGKRSLGRVEFFAENEARIWKVGKFALGNADGKVAATGRWITGSAPQVEVEFDIDAEDIGKFLARFGYADAVRQGKGGLDGQLSWRGSPLALHQPSLTGALRVKAEKGQFNKLEPGFGKLLSLLSLQTLPRRVALDFRDVFSEGFAFDRIEGSTTVVSGVMATRDLVIEGAAARVLMEGLVDLARETQDLKVTIQPEIGGTVALGAAVVVNPVAGVAALLAQKVMKDPLNKAFAFEYRITGSLSEPKVEKVGGPPPAPAGTESPVPKK